MEQSHFRIVIAMLGLGLFLRTAFYCAAKDLEFKRYQFRKKSTWGRAVNRQERVCKEEVCVNNEEGLLQDICIRKCMAPHCYQELYAWNELEEGERDIRWTSFKGCAAEELRKKQEAKEQEL
eukprot:Seg719.1 transcript_id=Seg719.1/GoldUCD/mRNA.D3Y31 product="hypothetical protein" protein_id=Seg719.1/GoldUCD/D3Y31